MKTSLLYSKHHLLKLFFVLFATLPFSYHCIEKPLAFKAPTWETPLNLTLVNKTFYFSDLVNKDSKFDTTTGVVLYRPTENAIGSKQGIKKDVFNMPSPVGNTIRQELGVVPVDIGTPPTFGLAATDLGINTSNLNPTFDPQKDSLSPSQLGMPTGIPFVADIPGVQIDQNFGDNSKFTYLIFANGTMSLKITNKFPFAIKFAGDSLRLVNFNSANDTNQTVANFVFSGQINAGVAATSNPISLAGVKMDGILKLKGTMSTVGATGKQLSTNDKLLSELTITNPKIQSMVPDPAPPFTLNQIFGDSTNYIYIKFDKGQMGLSVKNSFPFDIQFVGNALNLVNKSDTTQVVGTFTFPGDGTIPAKTTLASLPVDLQGKQMNAILKLKGSVKISKYFGTTVFNTDSIVTKISLTNGYLQTAKVNTINFNPTDLVAVPDSAILLDEKIKVKLAKFESGAMKIRIVNTAATKLSVKFGISELKDNLKNGQIYTLPGTNQDTIVTINPKDSLVTTINMKDVSFVSRDKTLSGDTLVTQFLHFGLEIKTLKATSGYVTINKTDYVVADVQPAGSFVLTEIQGKIPPDTLYISEPFDVSIGDIGDNLTLKGIKSDIKLSAHIQLKGKLFPTDIKLYVVPVNKIGGYADSVLISDRISSGSSVIPIDTASVNKLMNSFLASRGELPSKFLIRGNLIISPKDVYEANTPESIGGVTQKDSVLVNLDYAIPVQIGIKDGVLKDPPTPFSQTADTTQVNLIKNGKIYLDFTNTFPLDVEMNLKLLKGITVKKDSVIADTVSAPVLMIPQHPSDSVNYPPLRVFADTTTARTGQHSFTFLNLTPEDAKKISSASFSAVDLKMKTAGNGNTPKVFNLTDKLVMSVKADIIFVVDKDKLK